MEDIKTIVEKELTRLYPQFIVNVQKVVGYNREWAEDLLPVTIEMFLKMNPEKQLKIVQEGKLENYITKAMKLQLVWKSDFNRLYRAKEKSREFYYNKVYPNTISNEYETYGEGESTEDLAIECMKKIIDQYDPFLKEVANKVYMGNETLRTLSRRYKINYYHIKAALRVIQEDLRIHCSHCWEDK